MVRNKKMSGFTLIELMVVIVIIGVLSSLAIPRFTQAADKAKIAEAPRIIASFESAYLAALAETGKVESNSDLIFESPASKWFNYDIGTVAKMDAIALSKMGSLENGESLITEYVNDKFNRSINATNISGVTKMIPNFIISGAANNGGGGGDGDGGGSDE